MVALEFAGNLEFFYEFAYLFYYFIFGLDFEIARFYL